MSSASSALGHKIVRAGAGAGKTTTLIRTVMDEIARSRSQGKWPKLLVTTFTRKATQELRERLTAEACQTGDLELLDYCRSRSRLHISTIHGVLALFLRRYGHLLGIDPSYSILTELGARQMRRLVLRDILQQHPHGVKLLETYSLSRLEGILRQYKELTSGRTPPRPIQARELLEFTANEARGFADETRQLAAAIVQATDNPKALAYVEFLQAMAKTLSALKPDSGWPLLKVLAEEWPNKPPARGGQSALGGLDEDVTEHKRRLGKWLDNEANDPKMAQMFAQWADQFQPLGEEFSQRLTQVKMAQGTLEMNDLEEMTLASIREQPAVAQAFAVDWDFWLVDEFQDTSPLQVELIERLSGDRPRFIVGDPQQSIYLFRGARMEVFAEEEKAVQSRGGQHQVLNRNYRSTPSLLAFLNDFLATVGQGFMPLEPRTVEFQPQNTVARFFAAPRSEDGIKREVEYLGLVQQIQNLSEQPGVALSDICVLARKNRNLFDIAQYLKSWGIPTHVHASRGFYERREVQDALALLKFLVVPQDNQGLMNVLRSPWCRITDQELVAHLKREPRSFWQQLLNGPLAEHSVIQALKIAIEQAQVQGYGAAWEKALVQFGFFDFSGHHDATGRREANLWKLVSTLALAERRPGFRILEFVQQGSLQQADTESGDEGDAVTAVEPNVVNLMTIHAAKGLERRHVLIPHCDEGIRSRGAGDFGFQEDTGAFALSLPGADGTMVASPLSRRQRDEQTVKELAEQDRLLYVALTRAQDSVYLSWTGEPDSTSWAARWGWKNPAPGLIVRDTYSFEVIAEVPAPRKRNSDGEKVGGLRPQLQVSAPALAKPVMSVVNLIQTESPVMGSPSSGSVPEFVGRAVKGTAFHRLLEQVRLNPQVSFQKMAQQWFPNDADTVIKAIEEVRKCQRPPMAELLKCGFPEWGFQIETDHIVLEGQIDLWGIVEGTLWILDYKSGNPLHVAKAFAQLEIYAHALRGFGHQQPIQLAVLYPFVGKVEVKEYTGNSAEQYPLLSRSKVKFSFT